MWRTARENNLFVFHLRWLVRWQLALFYLLHFLSHCVFPVCGPSYTRAKKSNPIPTPHSIEGTPIQTIKEARYIDVFFTENLWSPDVHNITAKTSRVLGFRRINFKKYRIKVKSTPHVSKVRPNLLHAKSWGSWKQRIDKRDCAKVAATLLRQSI